MIVEIETPKGSIEYDVAVMKTQKYSLEELFEKRLLFLLPYYIFKHESKLEEYDKDIDKLYDLQAECYKIVMQLEDMVRTKEIDVYTKQTIMELSNIVAAKLASKYQNVVEGVKTVMGGKILDYPAKDILNQGKAEGRVEGKLEEKLNNAKALLDLLDDEVIAERIGLSIEEVKALH